MISDQRQKDIHVTNFMSPGIKKTEKQLEKYADV